MNTHFKILDLDSKCQAVTWPGFEVVFCNTEHKIKTLLGVLFDDMRVWEAHLGVVPWHTPRGNMSDPRVIQNLSLSSTAWLENADVAWHMLRDRLVVGVKFGQPGQARQFVDLMQQRLMWHRLGGKWS